MNIFDYINNALNKTTENIINNLTDTIEDFKNLINNKIQLEKTERSLQEYFENDGKEMYINLTDFHGEKEAYYALNVGADGKQEFSIYNVKPKNYSLNVEKNIENIEESVVFRLKSGKVVIDEEMTREYRNARNDNTNCFSRLENVIKENKLPADFLENMEKDMLMEMFNYLDENLENKSLYKVDSEIINGFCVICEIRKEKDEVPSTQIEKYKILASELPEGACQNTLLIKENGKFIIDKEASRIVENKLVEKVENFLKELNKDYIKEKKIYELSKLPQNTLLEINEIENEYVVCYFNHQKYDIPKEMVCLKDLEDFNMSLDRLQLQKDGLYHIVKHQKTLGKVFI